MEKLTIGFDAKRAVFNNTGLGNYSRLVVDLLARHNPEWKLRLYTPKPKRENARLTPVLAHRNVELVTPSGMLGRLLPSVWRSVAGMGREAKADGVDIFHGLSGELPPDIAGSGVKTVVTIHDLIFRRHPENYSAPDVRIYDRKFRKAVGRADIVVAISQRTKDDIVEFYGTDPGKIVVVRQGCHAQFSPRGVDEIDAVKRRYGIVGRYVVAVGTVEVRKNQELALKALPALPADIKLVIVGGDHGGYAKRLEGIIADLGVADRVVRLRGVDFADLPALYSGALFSSYTSRYEGFGLPLIESLRCATPAIAATGSCLEEAAGPGAIYVGPGDVEGYVAAAKRLIADAALRKSMAEAGRDHTEQFSDENFERGLREVYSRLLGR